MTRILLVHGALADGSSWGSVIPHLQAAGHSVTAVQQPLTSIPDDVAVVKNGIKTLNDQGSEPIVVVGHSFGGVVITNAAAGAANIKALVYVQAFAPDEGETAIEHAAQFGELESAKHFGPEASGRLVLPQDAFVKFFAPDVETKQAQAIAAVQGPSDAPRFGFKSGAPAWKEVKDLYYIVGEKDQIIQPELQSFLAKRMGAKTTVLAGASHAGLISQADKVAKVILEAAA